MKREETPLGESFRRFGEDFVRRYAAGIRKHAETVREVCRRLYGACTRCEEPLAGPSPSQLCADCHAAIVLEQARGEEPAVEA